jgi:ubiquitin-protein ligase
MALKRVMADIRELENAIYKDNNIFYYVNEANMMEGYACIFGPKDTPYEDCPMLYKVTVSLTYPFDPPVVEFLTYDGVTRFHPNMYIEKKVCLSILHTWSGPRWASTMRISTVLVTLQSLLDKDPLRHEPGYDVGKDDKCKSYAKYIEIACIRYILERAENLGGGVQPSAFQPFVEVFEQRVGSILDRLEQRLAELIKNGNEVFVDLPYRGFCKTTYEELMERVVKLKG